MSRFLKEIEKGLKKDTHPKADVKCFVTYVQDLPNGKGKKCTKQSPESLFEKLNEALKLLKKL